MGNERSRMADSAPQMGIELLVVGLLNDLLRVSGPDVPAVLQATVARLGLACGFDRTFVFQRRLDGSYFNSHEWVAPGVQSLIENLQHFQGDDLPNWHARLQAGEAIFVPDARLLEDGLAEKALLAGQGVRSTLMMPMVQGGQLIGVLGYDSTEATPSYTPNEMFLFSSVAQAIGTVLHRTRADEALAASRSRLAATLRAIPDLVVEVDGKGTVVACHGTTPRGGLLVARDPVGQGLAAVFPADLAGLMRAMMHEAHSPPANGAPARRDRRYGQDMATGRRWYDVSAAQIDGPGGAPGCVFVIRDVTAPVSAADEAAYREGLLESLFGMSPLAFLLNDYETGQIVDVNQSFATLYHSDRAALCAGTLASIIPSDNAHLLAQAREQLRATGRYGPITGAFCRQDGSRFDVVLRGFQFVDLSGRRKIWSMVEDVSEARQQAQALEQQRREAQDARANLATAVEALPDGFVLFDADDRLALFNSRYLALFPALADLIKVGARYEDLLQAALDRGLHQRSLGREQEFLAEMRTNHRADQFEGDFMLTDGRIIHCKEHMTPDGGRVGLRSEVTAQRQSEQRLANVIEGAQVGTWEWDAITGQNRINGRWMSMLGYRLDQAPDFVTIEQWEDLLHPDDRGLVRQTLAQVYRNNQNRFEYTLRMRHAEGHWVWVQSRGQVLLRQPDGSPRLMAGVHIDVSALVKAEQRLERLIHGAKVGTWEYDRRTRLNLINDRWAEMLGYSRADLDPMTREKWVALVHPGDFRQMQTAEDLAYARGEREFDFQFRLKHRLGHWVWIQSRGEVVLWDASAVPVVMAGVHLDITEAKALEISLLRERDTLATLMEASISGITAVDAKGRIVFANHEAEAVLGRAGDAIEGQVYDSVDWAISDLAGQPIPVGDLPVAQVLATQTTVRDYRHLIRRPDGVQRVLSVNAAPLSAPGTDLAVVCSVMDITDMVEAEAALRVAIVRAEAANRAKSEFLATMSHEIRTPLNGVLGMAEMLAVQLGDPEQAAMVQVIRQSGEHLLAVINDILDLAQIESGRLVLDPGPLRPSELAARIDGLHGLAARDKGISLEVEAATGSSDWRMGDAKRLMQILHNLVGNAVKFTHKGRVRLRVMVSGADVIFEVTDTGIGMDPARIDEVFEDFIQGEAGIARRYGGNGLGLPITRRLTQAMGGTITLRSEAGHGLRAVVIVPLPLFQSRNAAAARPDSPPLPSLPPLRVLVAEDNATNRVILRAMLDSLGLTYVQVTDGDEAVDQWQPGLFDLLLFDISMPRKDGIAALHDIARKAQAAGVTLPPALAVTANAMTHHVAEYLAAGFAACVAKPMRLDDLAQAIVATLRD
ncbi:MAG: PAS domain S-box protein [Pseudomonadota bacterium]